MSMVAVPEASHHLVNKAYRRAAAQGHRNRGNRGTHQGTGTSDGAKMNIGLERRLGRLEEFGGIGDKTPRKKVILIAEPDEPDGPAAIERYRAEHPESADDTDFIVIVTGFFVPPKPGLTWDGRQWRETKDSVM
jgi:hypothetical protein